MNIHLAYVNQPLPAYRERLMGDLKARLPFAISDGLLTLDLKPFFNAQRNQYYSTKILLQLIANRPEGAGKILGLVAPDLYIPVLTFLFGEAQLNGPGAVVSTFRLHNAFYGLREDPALLYDRLLKECLHELGHTLGLVHCEDFRCVMYASTYIEESDIKAADFCGRCREGLAG